jgi:hypothetical protein
MKGANGSSAHATLAPSGGRPRPSPAHRQGYRRGPATILCPLLNEREPNGLAQGRGSAQLATVAAVLRRRRPVMLAFAPVAPSGGRCARAPTKPDDAPSQEHNRRPARSAPADKRPNASDDLPPPAWVYSQSCTHWTRNRMVWNARRVEFFRWRPVVAVSKDRKRMAAATTRRWRLPARRRKGLPGRSAGATSRF